MILYHFTKPDYLHSVLTEGLIPDGANKKWRRSGMARGCNWKCIFLTDNPDYIVDHQCGKDWDRVLLKVDCTDLQILDHYWMHESKAAPHEFVHFGQIEPSRIKCVSTY